MTRIRQRLSGWNYSGFEKLMLGMLLTSCIALVAEPIINKDSLVISPASGGYPVNLIDDRGNGGDSIAEWIDHDKYIWSCNIGHKYQYPYCQFQLLLDGVNLSRFDRMRIDLAYSGPDENQTVRVVLINQADIGGSNSSASLKHSEVHIAAANLGQPYIIDMNRLRVPDWMVDKNQPWVDAVQPDTNNVIVIEILTGADVSDGPHHFRLHSIEWEGSIVKKEYWYLAFIVVWLLVIFITLVYRMFKLSSELLRRHRNERELQKLNRALDVRSAHFEKLAHTDPLTSIANRAGIGDFLQREMRSQVQTKNPLCVIMMDIDHFKAINDNHGHDAGDAVLIAVAKKLSETLRAADGVSRWGGEEFLLVCPNTSLHNGMALAEKLRMQLKMLPLPGGITATASFGVATLGDESLDTLIKRVDAALYEAKNSGRDRVAVAQPPAA